MKTIDAMRKERERLQQEIVDNLDFLMGSISTKGPSRPGLNLTFKIDQVTRTRHIRKDLEVRVKEMTIRWRRLRVLLHKLSDMNWERLNRGVL